MIVTKVNNLCAGVVLATLGSVATVHAAPILSISAQGLSDAQAAEANFLAGLEGGYTTETFDSGYTVGATGQSLTINNVVGTGTFTSNVQGTSGVCNSQGLACSEGLAVLNSDNNQFGGRFAISGDNWLDSVDAQDMSLTLMPGQTSAGFFLTDPNDSGGLFEIGGSTWNAFSLLGNSSLNNGGVYYDSLYDAEGLTDISIRANNSDDYGIDNLTMGLVKVPEPATLALMALGLFGLVSFSRRKPS
ncbi:PEP-CTERM sorting domain-containing protein [Marinobacter changyiensis]|uniref:PEP-CTERM sorting domain-containing protein n=1 Tax=Marinobacter changyiensis TaxID=2604091 RepID=UPI0012645910|nr:PEP-CTERM sorting domain-containing protein [Marinobacter changyiensis]